MMATASSSTNYPSVLKVAVIVLIFLLTHLPSKPAEGSSTFSSYDRESVKEREKLVGSRPPGCVNKCLNCKPCNATLVIHPPPQWKPLWTRTTSNDEEGNGSYYALSWKCKCGNKLFHP